MTIGIDAREIGPQAAGKGQYCIRIVSEWVASSSHDLILYIKPHQDEAETLRTIGAAENQRVRVIAVGGKGSIWHWNVAKRLSGDKTSVFFAPLTYQSAAFNHVPTVTVVHDLATFRLPKLRHNWRSFAIDRLFLRSAAKRSVKFISVSHSTKRDLMEFGGVAEDQIVVTHLGPTIEPSEPVLLEQRGSHLLYLGTLEPRKNILSIIRAYAGLSPDLRARHHLILAGKKGWGNEDYEGEATILGVANTCEFLGFVNGEKRLELLKTARALVWPSIYEGFGLPALEAMSVGTPVVTSNVSSIPEITGDAAILCEPYDIDAIRVGIERLLTDNSYWRHLCAAGFERSKAFRWDESASATMDVMESVAG